MTNTTSCNRQAMVDKLIGAIRPVYDLCLVLTIQRIEGNAQQEFDNTCIRDIKTLGKHINNVFKEGELDNKAVVAKFVTTAADGKTYQVEHYNLDVIISVGYRVKSQRGTQFRIWATQRLREYLVQGYTLNEQRFDKNSAELPND